MTIEVLTQALKLAENQRFARAHEVLHTLWAETRSPPLGALLRELFRSLTPLQGPLAVRNVPRSLRGLCALAALRQGGDLVPLLSGVPDLRHPSVADELIPWLFDNNLMWRTRVEVIPIILTHFDAASRALLQKLMAQHDGMHPALKMRFGGELEGFQATPIETTVPTRLRELLLAGMAQLNEQIATARNAADEKQLQQAQAKKERSNRKPRPQWVRPAASSLPRLASTHLLNEIVSKPVVATPAANATIESLLGEWRGSRSEAVADQLTALDAKAQRALDRENEGELDAVWSQRARDGDVRVTGWLARTLVRGLVLEDATDAFFAIYGIETPSASARAAYINERYRAFFWRIDALARRVPDPRIGEMLAWHLSRKKLEVSEPELFHRMIEVLILAGDTRQARVLSKALEDSPWERQSDRNYLKAELPRAIEQLGGAAGVSAASKIASQAELDGLMSAIVAAPDDDSPRLMLADWLSERGYARGELIALQLAEAQGKASKAEKTRAASLVRLHTPAWLGPLARVLARREWKRGFLDSAALERNAIAPHETWSEAFTHPALELVTTLTKGTGNVKHYAGFLSGGRLCHLDASCIPKGVRLV